LEQAVRQGAGDLRTVADADNSSPELQASSGAIAAMARGIFEEWHMARALGTFRDWLERGAPSDDANETSEKSPASNI